MSTEDEPAGQPGGGSFVPVETYVSTAPTPTPATLITVEAVAERLDVPVGYVRRLVRERRLRFYKLGNRTLRFDPADVDQLILAGRREAVAGK